jgi:hypothetical protein
MCTQGPSSGRRWRRAESGIRGSTTSMGSNHFGPTANREGNSTYSPAHARRAKSAGQRGSPRPLFLIYVSELCENDVRALGMSSEVKFTLLSIFPNPLLESGSRFPVAGIAT